MTRHPRTTPARLTPVLRAPGVRTPGLRTPGLLAVGLLALAACGTGPTEPTGSQATPVAGAIAVTADGARCEVATAAAPAGRVAFSIRNTGSAVTEFYVHGEQDRVAAEAANIQPGQTRVLHVDLSRAGSYQTSCKPRGLGETARAAFTVTASSGDVAPAAQTAQAVTAYQAFVRTQADELVTRTTSFVHAVQARDVAAARAAYPRARAPWERIEPVAESFGDLDPRIDGREDVTSEGMAFTGFHRLEKDLWTTGLRPDSSRVAAQLLTDVREIAGRATRVTLTPLDLANGAKALLDEVATGKITGEEERYSHTDLYDFAENVAGSKAAVAALRPVLQGRDPALARTLDSRFRALEARLATHARGDRYVSYTTLTPADLKELSVALDALSEAVARVPGLVAAA